jgi:hypothetical protein
MVRHLEVSKIIAIFMKRNDETTIEKISTHWESREKGSRDISVQRVDSNLLYKKNKAT